ncbi:DHA2 family efflux MFS transporter permease subunit [Methylobacterium sp. EM32]|uniref:DHA2 family efflux MFS transporter permease subunit n=1 Tax=Methylobacterium sp. EM32 TaxID=3163481 RepID=UPI0033A8901D
MSVLPSASTAPDDRTPDRHAGSVEGRGAEADRAVRPNQVLAIVSLGIVLANLDLFIVNVALPDIARDFAGSGLDRLSWILNGYAIVYAALLVFFGRLAERYRRDRSFLLGVALFTFASAACAAAPSVEALVAFRLVQAAGAALMTPTSLGLLLATFPPEGRGGAVRFWTAIGGFAAALGPVVGGLLVAWSWRWIFLVNLPIGLLALVVGLWKLPAVPGHAILRPRVWGALLVTLGVGILTYGIMKSPEWGWSSGPLALTLGTALVLFGLFVRDCLRSTNPLVDLSLFRIRAFTGSALILVPFSIAFGAMLLSIALWLQDGWGWSGLKAGLAIAPGPFVVPLTSLFLAGRLIARLGPAPVVALGVVSFAACFGWWAAMVGPEPSMAVAVVGMLLSGLGVGLTVPTLMGAGLATLPASSFATGSGILNMVRQTAIALGVAILVAVIGGPDTVSGRLAAYEHAWWLMGAVALAGLIPLPLLRRRTQGRA